jgi:CRP-like cAMP-binding protein
LTAAGVTRPITARSIRGWCSQGLFGESSLIGPLNRAESAIALDSVTLMSWSRKEIEQQVERDPRLGIALAQYLVRQCLDLQDRIESMASARRWSA